MNKRPRLTYDSDIDNKVSADVGAAIFLNNNFADFHFLFKEGDVCQRIPAHKAILAAASDVFATMLNGDWKEENEVMIEDASFDVFKEFLQFFYLPKVNVSMENIWEVINLANKYNVRECMELCEPQIINQLTPDDVCTNLDFAIQFDFKKLKKCCLEKIADDTRTIFATEAFLGCSKYALESILQIEAIDCSEIKIFNACLNWAKYACERKKKDPSIISNVRSELGDFLHAIRFGSMKPEQISACVSENEGFFNQSELEDLWLSIGPDTNKLKIFKNTSTRRKPWLDRQMVVCNLQISTTGNSRLRRLESITFQISKTLFFGGISVKRLKPEFSFSDASSIKANVIVFQLSSNPKYPKQQTQILNQTVQLDVRWDHGNGQQYLKFETPIPVQANSECEVCIDTESGCYYYSGVTVDVQQKQFGDGIVINTMNKCSNFINLLHFYSTEEE